MNQSQRISVIRPIKEKACRVSVNENFDDGKDYRTSINGVDVVVPYRTMTQAAEPFFHPELLGAGNEGLGVLTVKAIESCPKNVRRRLYNHIYVMGGSSAYRGWTTRLKKEIEAAFTSKHGVAPEETANDISPRLEKPALSLQDQLNMVQLSPVTKKKSLDNQKEEAAESVLLSPRSRFRKSVYKIDALRLELSSVSRTSSLLDSDSSSTLSTPDQDLVITSPRTKRKKTRIAVKVKGLPREERKNAAWLGGSVLASVPDNLSMWISKDEYFEQGASIVNSKCFSGHVSLGTRKEVKTAQTNKLEGKAIVIDMGSQTIRAGLASEIEPTVTIPTVIGKTKLDSTIGTKTISNSPIAQRKTKRVGSLYIGKSIENKKGVLSLEHPVKYGIIENKEAADEIWAHLFARELKIDPTEHPVLLTEPPDNPPALREFACQTMFEKYDVPGFYLACDAVLGIVAKGAVTGTAVQSGATTCSIVPVYRGCPLTGSIQNLRLGGVDIDDYLSRLIG